MRPQLSECFHLHYLIPFASWRSTFQEIPGIVKVRGLAQGHPVRNGAGRAAQIPQCWGSVLHSSESTASASLSKSPKLP